MMASLGRVPLLWAQSTDAGGIQHCKLPQVVAVQVYGMGIHYDLEDQGAAWIVPGDLHRHSAAFAYLTRPRRLRSGSRGPGRDSASFGAARDQQGGCEQSDREHSEPNPNPP